GMVRDRREEAGDRLRVAARDAGHAREHLDRRLAHGAQRAERGQERAPLAGPDPGQLLEDRGEVLLRAQLALELDRKAVRLVAHALEQQQRPRARRQQDRVLAIREEYALALEPARAFHPRRGRSLVLLLR